MNIELTNYIKLLTKEDNLLNEVMTLVKERLFNKFITATNDERIEISNIMNAGNCFINELRTLSSEQEQDINI